jgi:nucleotide-binding universal stress UspA family protein
MERKKPAQRCASCGHPDFGTIGRPIDFSQGRIEPPIQIAFEGRRYVQTIGRQAMYRHILIPTDGSELAERGVAHGLALAKSVGAKVSVIYVVEPLLAVTGDYASVLDRTADAAREAGIACETIQVEDVPPHQAIIAAAEDKGCNLIVMSWHGRSGLSTLVIGSVTNKVLAYAKIPVLVCR